MVFDPYHSGKKAFHEQEETAYSRRK
jgi:hypothetical protein